MDRLHSTSPIMDPSVPLVVDNGTGVGGTVVLVSVPLILRYSSSSAVGPDPTFLNMVSMLDSSQSLS
jgi:hypothetical protein